VAEGLFVHTQAVLEAGILCCDNRNGSGGTGISVFTSQPPSHTCRDKRLQRAYAPTVSSCSERGPKEIHHDVWAPNRSRDAQFAPPRPSPEQVASWLRRDVVRRRLVTRAGDVSSSTRASRDGTSRRPGWRGLFVPLPVPYRLAIRPSQPNGPANLEVISGRKTSGL